MLRYHVKSRARAAVSLFHLEPKQSSVQPCWLAHALFGFQRNFCSRILPQHCLTMEYAQKHAKQSPGAQNCSKQQQVKSHSSYQPQTSHSERSGELTERAVNAVQKLSFQRWLQIAREVFRKDSRKDAWISSYQESNKLMQRINSKCSSSKTKSRNTQSNSKSTQTNSKLRKKNVYWATNKRSVNFSQ